MSIGRGRAALAVAAGILLTLLSGAVPTAYGQGAEAQEVRVAAQRLADGRTEFALQQREADGTWGERRLPRARFFPANTAAGRWLASSPLSIAAEPDRLSAVAGESEIALRVAAQRLADGRMEFALQQREADGTWGERRLPRARFFPANTAAGRWLASSPLTVGVGAAARAPTPTPTAIPTPTACVLADSVGRVAAATFQVQTTTGTGTAFHVGNGEWLTNHHVVETVDHVSLVYGATRLSAEVVGSLPNYDLALLRAHPPAATPVLRLEAVRPAQASPVSAVGFPARVAGTPSFTRGIVSKHAPGSQFGLAADSVLVQIDAEINPGNSGGPIVDDCGDVVGVAVLKAATSREGRDLDGIGFGIAAETVTAQLTALRSATHYARQPTTAPAPASTSLEISALCNVEASTTFETCGAAGARGLPNGPSTIFVGGVTDYANVRYSIDGGEARDSPSLRDLGRGSHTLQANERRATGWTGWSARYSFTITGAAPLEIRAICNGDWADYDTSSDCFAAGSGGILAEGSPVIWVLGVSDWENVHYSIDGGPPVAWGDFSLRNLAPGFHTVQASEQQAAGWTGWTEPYAFSITGAAPIEIRAICNRGVHDSSDACRADGANGILAERSPSIWRRGSVNTENDLYSIDGGEAVTRQDFTLRSLTVGRHQVRLGERQPAGWTGWSEPYWFTITGAAPLEIIAVCDSPGAGHTSDECQAAPVTRGGRHTLWRRGVVEPDNLRFSIDGGVAADSLSLSALTNGRHNIRIGEQQPAGWTG